MQNHMHISSSQKLPSIHTCTETHTQILSITELEANSISVIRVFTITDYTIKCGLVKIFHESLEKVTWAMIFLPGIAVAMVSASNLLFPPPDSVMYFSFGIYKPFMKMSSYKVFSRALAQTTF